LIAWEIGLHSAAGFDDRMMVTTRPKGELIVIDAAKFTWKARLSRRIGDLNVVAIICSRS
jgi:hypothetical protein